jgi:hypothetical protein
MVIGILMIIATGINSPLNTITLATILYTESHYPKKKEPNLKKPETAC